MSTDLKTMVQDAEVQDTFPINGTDYLEFYVGNAKQAAMYYMVAFGYEMVAYRGPETGERELVSYVMQQNKIRLILTSALNPDHTVAKHVQQHGDGVKVLALWVDDATTAFEKAVERGAKAAIAPRTISDEDGQVVMSSIHTYGETIHTFVERKNYKGVFMPGFAAQTSTRKVDPVGLQYVDHCVGNVELGGMNKWVKFLSGCIGIQALSHF